MVQAGISYIFESKNEEFTERLANEIASRIRPGTVIALDGDLGAGKTRFSQALAKAIGVEGIVNSPTFTIIKEYEGTEFPFYHMDVYRITMAEADELGLDDYFYGDGVTVVEWASMIQFLLPSDHLEIYIDDNEGSDRTFRIQPHGSKYHELCRELKRNGVIS